MDTATPILNILVVEDNENLRETIVDALFSLGHNVRGVDCAEAVPEQADLLQLDIAILDLNLPGEDGLSLASRLRETHARLGIIMLTARVQSEERAAGYAQGADIYLTKPASLNELKQAIQALTRRLPHLQRIEKSAGARFDPLRMILAHANGQQETLNASECGLLVAFIRAAQNTLENWQIAEILGMNSEHINKPAIELHILRLRKKLPSEEGSRSSIQAVRGRGYQLCVPIRLP